MLTDIFESEFLKEINKVYTGERDQKLACNLVKTCENTFQFLLLVQGDAYLVCTPSGVYSRKGAPVLLTFCFSKKYLCQQL